MRKKHTKVIEHRYLQKKLFILLMKNKTKKSKTRRKEYNNIKKCNKLCNNV